MAIFNSKLLVYQRVPPMLGMVNIYHPTKNGESLGMVNMALLANITDKYTFFVGFITPIS